MRSLPKQIPNKRRPSDSAPRARRPPRQPRRPPPRQGPGLRPLGLPPRAPRTPDRVDVAIGCTLCASLVIIILYKHVTNTLEYMTQPCHLVSL